MILLENLLVYKIALETGDMVYFMMRALGVYAKKRLGDQFSRAADSIALNIAAGHGRFYFKENKNYCWYARGSIFETKTANEMALNRKLISREEYNNLLAKLKNAMYVYMPVLKASV
jgi:four helix bundle protein